MTTEEMIADYRAAFRAANDKDVVVSYSRGWFTIGELSPMRRQKGQLARMTATLWKRAAAPEGNAHD